MSLYNVFDVAGSAMSAQNLRLNTTASNLANANSVSSSAGETYRARHPVFATQLQQAMQGRPGRESLMQEDSAVGVKVMGIVEDETPLIVEYSPNHPMADEEGYIYKPNVNVMEEMANMMSASRSYQTNVQIADSTKQLLSRTLRMGQNQ
ncbi:flagellar basal body rod protein FlgC [Aliidiomarina sedimenti]|uniref:Flagellar basal-body rod protein FlgC n=2 Tax=Aliidiomarina TaxID=1249554 RepID=A0A432WCU2_9GAMM|nr:MULTISPECIES: flagellar basal body rod protein FlgC [Aliidiomarina]RUO29881.1 flagellar basal body rod protein FlgC [Aliidiomarina sedimenti]RUO30220.1 flagellar basal body rod protein FlgC [Aliidiomarina soli]